MSQTQILPSVKPVRSQRIIVPLPILIEVPRIEAVERKNCVRDSESSYEAEWRRNMRRRRPRRRLRRHVRLSACAFLGLAPIAVAACFAWTGHAAMATPPPATASQDKGLTRVCLLDSDRADGFVGRRPTVTDLDRVTLLSVEAASPAPGPEVEDPVVLPGYLLPDNSREEPVHEGS